MSVSLNGSLNLHEILICQLCASDSHGQCITILLSFASGSPFAAVVGDMDSCSTPFLSACELHDSCLGTE